MPGTLCAPSCPWRAVVSAKPGVRQETPERIGTLPHCRDRRPCPGHRPPTCARRARAYVRSSCFHAAPASFGHPVLTTSPRASSSPMDCNGTSAFRRRTRGTLHPLPMLSPDRVQRLIRSFWPHRSAETQSDNRSLPWWPCRYRSRARPCLGDSVRNRSNDRTRAARPDSQADSSGQRQTETNKCHDDDQENCLNGPQNHTDLRGRRATGVH